MQTKLSNSETLSMRYMSADDLKMVLNWCKDEGWNVGKYDAEIYYYAFPKAHMLFWIDGKPVGAISIVQHSSNFFTIGTFIVKKEFRQKGYGAQIWQFAMGCVEKAPVVALYAVPAQVGRYRKSNFEPRFHMQRWEFFNAVNSTSSLNSNCQLMTKSSLPGVGDYDQKIFGTSRHNLLKKLLKIPSITAYFLKNQEGIVGFGIIRPCEKGFRIGPLFANSPEYAKELFSKLTSTVHGTEVFLDIPSTNPYALAFADYFQLKPVSENDTQAMFKGDSPQEFLANNERNYGIFSLEVG